MVSSRFLRFPVGSCGFPAGFLRVFSRFPAVSCGVSCVSCGFPTGFLRVPAGFLQVSCGFPVGFLQVSCSSKVPGFLKFPAEICAGFRKLAASLWQPRLSRIWVSQVPAFMQTRPALFVSLLQSNYLRLLQPFCHRSLHTQLPDLVKLAPHPLSCQHTSTNCGQSGLCGGPSCFLQAAVQHTPQHRHQQSGLYFSFHSSLLNLSRSSNAQAIRTACQH